MITKHAGSRLIERDISVDDIKSAIKTGEIIKQYEDDKPFPSCLILGTATNKTQIHVVVSSSTDSLYIITVYQPDTDEWHENLKTRKG